MALQPSDGCTVAGKQKRASKLESALLTAAFIVSLILAVPAAALNLLFTVNMVNPFTLMFMRSFQVQNGSSQPVRIWLVHQHEGAKPSLLMLYISPSIALPSFRTGGFRLKQGASTTITYDAEKTPLNTILVKADDGRILALAVDSQTAKDQGTYVIPPFSQLPTASAEHRAAMNESSMWTTLGPSLLMPVLPVCLYFVWRRRVLLRG